MSRAFTILVILGLLAVVALVPQMSREEALEEIKMPLYDPGELKEEKEYVLKKFGLSEVEFENIMKLPVRSHLDYANKLGIFNFLLKLKRFFD